MSFNFKIVCQDIKSRREFLRTPKDEIIKSFADLQYW